MGKEPTNGAHLLSNQIEHCPVQSSFSWEEFMGYSGESKGRVDIQVWDQKSYPIYGQTPKS